MDTEWETIEYNSIKQNFEIISLPQTPKKILRPQPRPLQKPKPKNNIITKQPIK